MLIRNSSEVYRYYRVTDEDSFRCWLLDMRISDDIGPVTTVLSTLGIYVVGIGKYGQVVEEIFLSFPVSTVRLETSFIRCGYAAFVSDRGWM